jgi:hypothetical protein
MLIPPYCPQELLFVGWSARLPRAGMPPVKGSCVGPVAGWVRLLCPQAGAAVVNDIESFLLADNDPGINEDVHAVDMKLSGLARNANICSSSASRRAQRIGHFSASTRHHLVGLHHTKRSSILMHGSLSPSN